MAKKPPELTHDDIKNREKFTKVYRYLNNLNQFGDICARHNLCEDTQKYLVMTALDSSLNKSERYTAISLTNVTEQRRVKDVTCDELEVFLIEVLERFNKDVEVVKMTDIERLDKMISSSTGDAIKLKAMELRQKLTEKALGSQALKPWQKIFMDVIMPKFEEYLELQRKKA